MTFFPLTMPFGAILTLGGVGTGFGASWLNSGASSSIKELVNNMISDQASGHLKLQEDIDEYQNVIPDMVKCLEYEKYLEVTEKTSGYIPFRSFSATYQETQDKRGLSKFVVQGGNLKDRVLNTGKVATILANGQRLANVIPYIKYAGLSNRAMKAKMIKDAVDAANLVKASGVTGAAENAARLSEVQKATSAFKVAKEGFKATAWGVTIAATGLALSVVDIAVNMKELADGSITADAQAYRKIAQEIEQEIRDIEKLLDISVDHD